MTPGASARPPTRDPAAPRRARTLDLRLLVPLAVAWPVLAFWGLVAPVGIVASGAAAVALAGAAALLGLRSPHGVRAPARLRWCAVQAAVVALVLVPACGQRLVRASGPVDELAAEQAVVTLTGPLAGDPRLLDPNRPGAPHRPGPSTWVVRVDVTSVTGRGSTTPVSTPVLLIGRGPRWQQLGWRDTVSVTARLAAAEPGDDVVAVASVLGEPVVRAGPGVLVAVSDVVRRRFRDATSHVWTDARGLVPALVVGDTSRTPPDLTEAMRETGLTHLSAVSGSNVTLVLASALGLAGLLRVRRRWRPLLAGGLLVGFVVLARPEPSVVRAAVMGGVGLLGLSTSRRRAGAPALAGAVLALLVWDPWLSRSFGFALSVVATLGLLVLARPWGDRVAARLPPPLRWVGPVVAVPVVAQVVCAPLLAPLQGSVSLVGVAANLLAAPFVAPTTVLGVGVAVLAVVWLLPASVLAWAAAAPAQALAGVARWCAGLPGTSVPWPDTATGAVLLAALTLALVAVGPWAWHRGRSRPLAAAAAVVLTAGAVTPTTTVSWPPPGWLLVVCDVGQGDGLVVAAGPGRAVVVDAGPDPSLVRRCLDRLEVAVVDLVVLTHFHADHVDGLPGVMGRPVGQVLTSWVADPPSEADRVRRLAAAASVPVGTLRAGDRLTVGPVAADVWWPARRIDAGSVPNNGSVVLTVHVGGLTLLLAGDVEREAAGAVAREAALDPVRWGRVDVLKVAHHGSANRDDHLLDAVSGRLALVSVGAGNDYGHPAPALLDALVSRGFEVHRTDEEGDLAVVVGDDGSPRVVSG